MDSPTDCSVISIPLLSKMVAIIFVASMMMPFFARYKAGGISMALSARPLATLSIMKYIALVSASCGVFADLAIPIICFFCLSEANSMTLVTKRSNSSASVPVTSSSGDFPCNCGKSNMAGSWP